MPKVSEPVDDTTPLAAARIDVPARIGWLLRSHRTVGGLSLRQMSGALLEHGVQLSSTTLGRIESEGQRSSGALDGYAAVLGLQDGSLRATVDLLCRTFAYAPDAPVEAPPDSLADFSAACEAVETDRPTGGEWLAFARQHAHPEGFGLPTHLLEPLVRRLAIEDGRALGDAERTRYDALTELRWSAYADLVHEVLEGLVHVPETMTVQRALGALSERPTPALLRWCGELLADPSVAVARGASYALQNMLVIGGLGPAAWFELVPLVERAARLGQDDGTRLDVLAQLCAALPAPLATAVRRVCVLPPDPPIAPRTWARSRHNEHYEFARAVARDACRRVAHPDEPLLERLLFEAMFDPRGVRMGTSTHLIGTSAFAHPVVESLAERYADGPDATSRAAAMRVVSAAYTGGPLPAIAPWLTTPSTTELHNALTVYGRSGTALPATAVARGLAGDDVLARRTVFALGMAEDPRLEDLVTTGPTADVRASARWWLDHGGRVLH
ncbi:hypothetical protein H5V45_06195 [Nocardioides sp. KIGAM211]|uniref:Uncharacterized protein n=1 Tax=Nocardioides luti TaxID=2761101 RepID=A0A7X0VB80_9ACTN|nr:hypothetical protein [Nocardioides luti]MBB6626908.1 hypothetical protein [Nocardioides luti]